MKFNKFHLIASFLILWFILILVNYFDNYEITPFVLDFGFKGLNFSIVKILITFINHFYSIILTILFLLSSFIIGNKLFKDRLLSFGIGFFVLGYLIFFLGIFKLFYPSVIVLSWFIISVISINKSTIQSLVSIWSEATLEFRKLKDEFKDAKVFFFIIVLFLSINIFLNFFASVTPEMFYDSLVYHLGLPRLYLINHKIFHVPHNFFSNYPSFVEMLYTLAISVNNDKFAKLINLSVSILCIISIYLISVKLFNRKVGVLAASIFYMAPITSTLSWIIGVDLFVVFFILLGFYVFINDFNSYVAALFVGLALSCKYTALFFIPGFLIMYIIERKKLKEILIFLVITFVMVMPWLIKNFIYTGDPVFPYLRDVFGGPFLNEDTFKILIAEQRILRIGNIIDFLKFPWDITMDIPNLTNMIGPIFLFLVPLILMPVSSEIDSKKHLKYVLLFFLSSLLFWIIVTHIIRFFIPGLAILSIILAYFSFKFFNFNRILKYILVAGITLILIINTFLSFYYFNFHYRPFPVIVGFQSKEEYLLENYYAYYSAFKYINENLSEDSKILFIGETRGFHSLKNFVASTVYDINPFIYLLKNSTKSEKIHEYLKKDKITHILINYNESRRINEKYKIFDLNPDENQLYGDFRKKYLEVVFKDADLCVFRIK